jgi:hypothetical protein
LPLRKELRRQVGEHNSEALAQRLRHSDVALRGLEVGVTGALLNLHGLVTSDGHPADTSRSKVVKTDRPRRRRPVVELVAVDPCPLEVAAKAAGHVALARSDHERLCTVLESKTRAVAKRIE